MQSRPVPESGLNRETTRSKDLRELPALPANQPELGAVHSHPVGGGDAGRPLIPPIPGVSVFFILEIQAQGARLKVQDLKLWEKKLGSGDLNPKLETRDPKLLWYETTGSAI